MCEFIVCVSKDIVILDCGPWSTMCKSRKFFFANLSQRKKVKILSEFSESMQLNVM